MVRENLLTPVVDGHMTRQAIKDAKRVVVKIGSSSLTANGGVDENKIRHLVDALAYEHQQGREIVLVSSGAIAAGLAPLGLTSRPKDLASQQAAASVGQSQLIQHYKDAFSCYQIEVGQVLLTAFDVISRSTFRQAFRTLTKLLQFRTLPIVNENDTVATQEIRFGDNDRLAALVAGMVSADAMILLSDVDCLYTSHPSEPGAKRVANVTNIDQLDVDVHRRGSAVGTGGMQTKLEAARICVKAGIPLLLTSASQVQQAFNGADIGTFFAASEKRLGRKLLWLEQVSQVQGRIFVDAGAVEAITKRRASLLAIGVTGVSGSFESGDPVAVVSPDGQVVARGLASYCADEMVEMAGKHSTELADSLGPGFDRPLIHADTIVEAVEPALSSNQ